MSRNPLIKDKMTSLKLRKFFLLKRIIMGVLVIVFISNPGYAFLYEVKVLSKPEIQKLSDEVLTDVYIDAVVEIEATKDFHRASGFTPKEYKQHKDLLKYRILLIQEIEKRKLEVPAADKKSESSKDK